MIFLTKKHRILTLICTLFVLSLSPYVHSSDEDTIIAIVNNHAITLTDLKQAMAPIVNQYTQTYPENEVREKILNLQKDMLKQLIDNKIILDEAVKEEFIVEESDIEKAYTKILDRFKSEKEFNDALQSQGISIKKLKDNLKEQIIIRNYPKTKLSGTIQIPPSEINNYYKLHIADFQEKDMVKLQHILIKKDPEKPGIAKDLIEEAYTELEKGESFSLLAKKYSQGPYAESGGDMGFVKKGELLPVLEKAAFSLPAGSFSTVIESSIGYHIVKVNAKREHRLKPLSEVSGQIEEILYQKKMKEIYDKWIDGLRETAYIKILQ